MIIKQSYFGFMILPCANPFTDRLQTSDIAAQDIFERIHLLNNKLTLRVKDEEMCQTVILHYRGQPVGFN